MLKSLTLLTVLTMATSTPIEHNSYILAQCPWPNCSDHSKRRYKSPYEHPPRPRSCCVPVGKGRTECFPCVTDTLTPEDRAIQ